ncbi:MAG: hypothetical protein ACR2KK_04150 [Acidimicrobiales bacterium]
MDIDVPRPPLHTSHLVAVLHETLPYPDRLGLERMQFPAMVRLGSALGLANLGPDDMPGLLKLNSLRNRMAHVLDWEPDEKSELELFNSLSAKSRHSAFGEKTLKDYEFPEGMRHMIASLAMALEVTRERLIEYRAEMMAQHQRVVKVLGFDSSHK